MIKSKKNMITVIVAALLLAALAIGYTGAFMSMNTNHKANSFTVKRPPDEIFAELTEPNWDDGGDDGAINMLPGATTPKDPTITNTSREDLNEWVAAKVSFRYLTGPNAGKVMSAADFAKVYDILDIDFDSDKAADPTWQRISGTSFDAEQVFVYPAELGKDASTIPLFTRLKIKPESVSTQTNAVIDMGNFEIHVEGFAKMVDTGETFNDFCNDVSGGSLIVWDE